MLFANNVLPTPGGPTNPNGLPSLEGFVIHLAIVCNNIFLASLCPYVILSKLLSKLFK